MTVHIPDGIEEDSFPEGRVISLLLLGREIPGLVAEEGIDFDEYARILGLDIAEGGSDALTTKAAAQGANLALTKQIRNPQSMELAAGRRLRWTPPRWHPNLGTTYEIRTSRRKIEYDEADVFGMVSSTEVQFADPTLARFWVRPRVNFGLGAPFLFDFAPANPIGDRAIFSLYPDREIRVIGEIGPHAIFSLYPDREIRKLISIPNQSIFSLYPDREIRVRERIGDKAIFSEYPDRPPRVRTDASGQPDGISDQAIFSQYPNRGIRKIGTIGDQAIFSEYPDRPIRVR